MKTSETHPGKLRELDRLEELFPQLFCTECPKMEILYVGAAPGHVNVAPEMGGAGHHLSLLEIEAKNVEALRSTGLFGYLKQGDVRFLSRQRWSHDFDVVFWRFGPEHVEIEHLQSIAAAMEKRARHVVIMISPSGPTPWHKPDAKEHPGMPHRSLPELQDFKDMGYHTNILNSGTGRPRGDGAMIIAWKWTGEWKWPQTSR